MHIGSCTALRIIRFVVVSFPVWCILSAITIGLLIIIVAIINMTEVPAALQSIMYYVVKGQIDQISLEQRFEDYQ